MLPSERLAIAAHLHVLLRRRTGRVTDTEWMAVNADYAREIIRFARMRARDDAAAVELAQWADKLELAIGLGSPPSSPGAPTLREGALNEAPAAPAPGAAPAAPVPDGPRYLRGIR